MRSPRRRALPAALALALATSTLAACGSDSDGGGDGTSAAGDEALVVYAGRDEALIKPLLEKFSEESDVEVEVRYGDTPDMTATLLEEGEDTPADVFISQDAGALGALAAEDALEELPEDITGAVMEDFTSTDGSWVGITGRARVLVYNSDSLSEDEVPGTVEELTDAKWKGKVGLPPGNASFQSFVTGFREAEGDDAAKTWLTGMKDNDTQIFEKNGDVLEAVDKGTIEIGLINHYYLAGYTEEVGEDKVKAKLKFPDAGDPGALVNVTGAAALSDHPGAEELITFLVSEEAQEHFAEETNEYPLVESVDAPEGLPALDEIDGPIEDLSDLADVETSIEMIHEAGLS